MWPDGKNNRIGGVMTVKEKILFDKIWSYYINAFPINQNKIGELLENLKNEADQNE